MRVGGRAGFGMFGSPVFGWEGYAPERGPGIREFEANFGFSVADWAEEHYVAFLLFFGALMDKSQFAAAGNARGHEDQRAMGVDRESFSFLRKGLILRVRTGNTHSHLH